MSIVITGVGGFIASNLFVEFKQKHNREHIMLSDDFANPQKNNYVVETYLHERIHRNILFLWLKQHAASTSFIFHLGARTDTTEFDKTVFDELNLQYSKNIWKFCAEKNIPLIYASSAATYGDGKLGYDDSHKLVENLKPLNPYGESKNEFDKWALSQSQKPPYWYGLKFFNVYGPNEYHKGRMASVVYHAFNQIKSTRRMKLFRSHHPDFKDGEQKRDFIYVRDVIKAILFLFNNKPESGIYNIGTGKARSFNDLVKCTFQAMGIPENIQYIDTPEDIRDKYQYFTEAKIDKLRNAGYKEEFTSLEDGIKDYVQNYLQHDACY